MRKLLFTLIISLLVTSASHAMDLEVYFDHKTFSIPGDTHYVETHLEFNGSSLEYRQLSNDLYQAKIQVTMILKQNGEIIDFKKIVIEGPETTLDNKIDFLDIQRFPIQNGDYTFELELMDVNDPKLEITNYTEEFNIDIPHDLPSVSDVTFLKAYAKAEVESDLSHSGYDLLPLVSDYFPTEVNSLIFYAEIYNSDVFFGDNELYLLTYLIRDRDTKKVVGSNKILKRQEAQSVTPLLATLDITDLDAGNYELVIEIRDQKNELVSGIEVDFYRQQMYPEMLEFDLTSVFTYAFDDKDMIYEYIKSSRPIASTVERSTIDHQIPVSDITMMQKYMYHFWTRRNAEDPEAAWLEYKENVKIVNENYSTRLKRGYDTERGRIYLQYGAPNTQAVKHNNMSIYPYEVWHYYSIGNFSNKRFLFYNTDHVTNDFALLTSDMPGEIKNNNWFEIMSQRNSPVNITTERVDRNYDNNGDAELEILRDLYFNPH